MRPMAFCLCAVLTAAALAGENGSKVTPVLQPDARILATLKSLGEGASAELPAAKVTGDLNAMANHMGLDRTGPRQRDWCAKMPWMPERGRAAYFGAGHNTMRINDVWEHDLASNTWVCLYGPDKFKNRKLENWSDTKLKDGLWVTDRGGPGIIGHQWGQCTYDPEIRAIVYWNSWFQPPKEHIARFVKNGDEAPPRHNPPLWLCYPESKKWEPVKPRKTGLPRPLNGANGMTYVPALKGSLWYSAAARHGPRMLFYNPREKSWKQIPVKGTPPRSDPVLVWVPDRKVVVGSSRLRGGGGRTCIYDPAKNEWKVVAEGKDLPGAYGCMSFDYDTVGKVCLLYSSRDMTLWAFDVETAKWEKVTPKGPPPPKGRATCYYNPDHNVFVVCMRTKTWVYRHKRAAS